MTMLVNIALFGWVLVVLVAFILLPPRRAVLVSMLAGWMFLPNAGYSFQGLPDYDKYGAVALSVLLGVALFDPNRLTRLRFHWIDVPIVVFCISPFFTSLANGLGAYDGVSAMTAQTIRWGIPYMIGRAYFTDARGIRELAVGLFIAGLVYVPLCLYEIRMSPQLHNMLYGYHQFGFVDTHRLGGYRPAVFLSNGLELGMWMAITSLIGVWLWRSGALRQLWGVPASWLASGLLAVTLLCRSLGALILLAGGMVMIFAAKWFNARMVLLLLVAAPVLYITLRATDFWHPERIVMSIAENVDESRARSLSERIEQEDVLARRAWERPLLGWGRWNRLRVADLDEQITLATDGYWIIVFGGQGLVGLVSFQLVILTPLVLLVRNVPARQLFSRRMAPALVLGVSLVLFNGDALFNAMINPIYPLIAGGVMGFGYRVVRLRAIQGRTGNDARQKRAVVGSTSVRSRGRLPRPANTQGWSAGMQRSRLRF